MAGQVDGILMVGMAVCLQLSTSGKVLIRVNGAAGTMP
jgi:hypothetical protein